jgi:hypothetical protein
MKNYNEFWYEYQKKYYIDKTKLFKFLAYTGYFLINIEGTWFMIEKNENKVKVVDKTDICQVILKYVRSLDDENFEKEKIENGLRNVITTLVSDSQLNLLDSIDLNLIKDNKENCFLFYENQWLRINQDEIEPGHYEDLDGVVWESMILDREIQLLDMKLEDFKEKSEFGKFIWNVCDKKLDRFYGLCSMIGYLLHRFQDPSINKSIVLMDQKISDSPNGGTGKGIIKTALEYMREVLVMDGKNFNWGNFAFQDMKHSTSIMAFEDVKRNFDSERLFSVLTDGLQVERKGENRFKIPKEDVPKILVITNYVLKGKGNSFERRRMEFELSQHYNGDHTPIDEFGHNLFTEWNQKEFNLFDNFMALCAQHYLKEGLIEVDKLNVELKRIEAETCNEFIQFISNISINKRHDRVQLYHEFNDQFPEISGERWYTNRTFVNWLKAYAEHKGYKYLVTRGDKGSTYFSFNKEVVQSEELKEQVLKIKEAVKEATNQVGTKESKSADPMEQMKKLRNKVKA